jgi:hypothetical protein
LLDMPGCLKGTEELRCSSYGHPVATSSLGIPVNKKSRGRPKTGIGPVIGVRLYPEMEGQLDAWIERQNDSPSRPEAIRRLVQLGLTASGINKTIRKKKGGA